MKWEEFFDTAFLRFQFQQVGYVLGRELKERKRLREEAVDGVVAGERDHRYSLRQKCGQTFPQEENNASLAASNLGEGKKHSFGLV